MVCENFQTGGQNVKMAYENFGGFNRACPTNGMVCKKINGKVNLRMVKYVVAPWLKSFHLHVGICTYCISTALPVPCGF